MTAIVVDEALCTRCGICSAICPAGIVEPAHEKNLPRVTDARSGLCIRCGHCEVSCPSQALLLDFLPEEKVRLPAGDGTISVQDLGVYLKKRRSVRHYTREPVAKGTITEILDIARYAASGGNRQPLEWLVVHDADEVNRLAGLTIDWMKTLRNGSHPMSSFVQPLIAAWERGGDPVCRGAPHLLVAHVPAGNPGASTDAIIALTYVDIAAPAFGIGTCWAGFLSMAAEAYIPLKEALALPPGRAFTYAMMFGYPQFKIYGIPRRNPVKVTYR